MEAKRTPQQDHQSWETADITTPRTQEAAVALGFFDGVHLGHQAVVGTAVEAAARQGLRPTVFTFRPQGLLPGAKTGAGLLQSDFQKFRVFSHLGVAQVVAPPFHSFMSLTPQQFVEELLHGVLRARVLCCGDNYHFGKAAAGDVALLRQLAEPLGIQVITVPAVQWQGQTVSSTRIRQALAAGEMEAVTAMLGAPFSIEGKVLHGKGLGRRLQSPTTNQSIPTGFAVPPHGVYLSQVWLPDQRSYWAVTNIGTRPTVDSDGAVNCESFLLDFAGDLYDQWVSTQLHQFLRPEQSFPDAAALSAQIQQDVAVARRIIEYKECL